jgi:polysaccharide biosynthesis protein VpsQ
MRRLAALLFLVFILLIILAADTGSMPGFIRAIYNFPGGDKVAHFILYGILAFLLARAFPSRPGRFPVPIVCLVLIIFAVLEELSQSFFSMRTFDLVDLTCSLLGILAGTWLAILKK